MKAWVIGGDSRAEGAFCCFQPRLGLLEELQVGLFVPGSDVPGGGAWCAVAKKWVLFSWSLGDVQGHFADVGRTAQG